MERNQRPTLEAAAAAVALLVAGSTVFFATFTAWWFALGLASLCVLLVFLTPVTMTVLALFSAAIAFLVTTQAVGFSVLATTLAAGALLLKSSIVAALALAAYTLLSGSPPSLPSWPLEAAEAPAPATRAATAAADVESERMRDWDRRFAAGTVRLARESQAEAMRFEDLSPSSPIKDLRAFAAQEGLLITEVDGRRKAEVYRQIAVELLRRAE